MEENEEFDSGFNTENIPITEEFWNYMEDYWHNNREFPESTESQLGKKADLVGGKVPATQLPSYVDDVLEFDTFDNLPNPGEKGKIYLITNNNTQFRWSGSEYIQLNSDVHFMTLNSDQNVTGKKYFITSGGSTDQNNKLIVASFDHSLPGMTFHKSDFGSGNINFNEDGFNFVDAQSSDYINSNAKGFKKSNSNDDYFLTGGGGHTPKNQFSLDNHKHQFLYNVDTGIVDSQSLLEDYKFKFNQRIESASPNIFPTVNNANAIISVGTHGGGFGNLLGVNGDGDWFSKNVVAGVYQPTWKQFAYRDWVLSNTNNKVPYTGATQDIYLNNKSIFYAQKLHAQGSIIHNNLGLSVLNDATSGYVSNPLIKIGAMAGNMITFTVKLYNYPYYYYEFQVNIYIYQNNVYEPRIIWRVGESGHIDRIEFFKDTNTGLFYIRPIISVGYPRLAITDVQGYGGDGTFFNENWSVVWGGDTTPLLLQGIINSVDFSGDSRVVNTHKAQEITARKVINKDLGTNEYIGVAQHNAQFQIGRTSDAKSLEFAVTDDGTSYIQSKEAGVGYNPLILNRNNSGGVSIGGTPVTGQGLTVNGSIYSVNGYCKEGSNDGFVLLGGTGHRPVSDFATPSFIAQNYALRTGSNATDTWVNTSSAVINNPYIPGKIKNAIGDDSYLQDATYGQVMGMVNTFSIANGNPTNDWYHRIKMLHNNSAGYFTEIAVQMTSGNSMFYRRYENGTDFGWVQVWDTQNLPVATTISWNEAYSWGNHALAGYLTSASLNGYATESWVSANFPNQTLSTGTEGLGGQTLTLSNGNAVTITNNFVTSPDGTRNPDDVKPNTSGNRVRFDFANASSVKGTGNYAGVMTYSPWDGTTASTGDSSYQLAFANQTGINGEGIPMLKLRKGIDDEWSSEWYKMWSEGDFSQSDINNWNYLAGHAATQTWTSTNFFSKSGGTIDGKVKLTPGVGVTGNNPVIGNGDPASLLLSGDNGLWGTSFGHNSSTGDLWIQPQRFDGGSAVYNINLAPLGGNVTVNNQTVATQSWVQSQNYTTPDFVEESVNQITAEHINPDYPVFATSKINTIIITEEFGREYLELDRDLIPERHITVTNLAPYDIDVRIEDNSIDTIRSGETTDYYITSEERLLKKGSFREASFLN